MLSLDKERALSSAKKLEKEDSEGIVLALADLYAQTGDPIHLPYFVEKFDKVEGYAQYGFIESYATVLKEADGKAIDKGAATFKEVAMDEGKMFWLRFLATKSINDLHAAIAERMAEVEKPSLAEVDGRLIGMLEEIKEWETDVRISSMYANFPDPAPKP